MNLIRLALTFTLLNSFISGAMAHTGSRLDWHSHLGGHLLEAGVIGLAMLVIFGGFRTWSKHRR